MSSQFVLIALFACTAIANASLLHGAALAPAIVAPYSSSFNAHHINHAVALPVAAPAPFAVAALGPFAAPLALPPRVAFAAPAPVAFAAPARIAAPVAAPFAAPLAAPFAAPLPFAPAPLPLAPAPLRYAAPAPILG